MGCYAVQQSCSAGPQAVSARLRVNPVPEVASSSGIRSRYGLAVRTMQKSFVGGIWHTAAQFDGWMCHTLREGAPDELEIHFSQDSRMSIGACVRLLSYLQELEVLGVAVALCGLSPWGLGGYLDRIGLFDLLPDRTDLRMARNTNRFADRRGQSASLEEIVAIPPDLPLDKDLPRRLSDKLAACATEDVRDSLKQAAFTYFAELIDNVRLHSEATRPGFAALQVYTPVSGARRMVEITVADTGKGIVKTLRPALRQRLASLSDEDLLLLAVNSGISRHGAEAGCGITQSAKGILRWPEPTLDLRLTDLRLGFVPDPKGGYLVAERRNAPALYPLPGTHWVARYCLD